jgi:hypothetical protein
MDLESIHPKDLETLLREAAYKNRDAKGHHPPEAGNRCRSTHFIRQRSTARGCLWPFCG